MNLLPNENKFTQFTQFTQITQFTQLFISFACNTFLTNFVKTYFLSSGKVENINLFTYSSILLSSGNNKKCLIAFALLNNFSLVNMNNLIKKRENIYKFIKTSKKHLCDKNI